jgi:hypothetical protein
LHHPNLVFVEANLKDHLHDNLKEFKIRTSNEEGSKKVTLQYDEVLECLRAASGHATKNILKRNQSLLYGSLVSIPSTLSFNFVDPIFHMFNPNVSLNSRPFTSDNDKLMIKAKMLQIQSKNMVTIIIRFSMTSNIQNIFLASKAEINNHELNKVKIIHLKPRCHHRRRIYNKDYFNFGLITRNP